MEIGEIEIAKQRCESVIRTIENLPLSTAITASCRRTLLKLASSELSFLSSLSSDPSPKPLRFSIFNHLFLLSLSLALILTLIFFPQSVSTLATLNQWYGFYSFRLSPAFRAFANRFLFRLVAFMLISFVLSEKFLYGSSSLIETLGTSPGTVIAMEAKV